MFPGGLCARSIKTVRYYNSSSFGCRRRRRFLGVFFSRWIEFVGWRVEFIWSSVGESGVRRRELEFSWRERESAVVKSVTGESRARRRELEFNWRERESAVGKREKVQLERVWFCSWFGGSKSIRMPRRNPARRCRQPQQQQARAVRFNYNGNLRLRYTTRLP